MLDTGNVAWMLISTALVFFMTPGLAFFYGGMVRSKNVLSTIMHSMFIIAMITVEWVLIGYTLVFGDGKIFVYDVADSMRIRTGTRGAKAVIDDEAVVE